jgi:hypothetical protein
MQTCDPPTPSESPLDELDASLASGLQKALQDAQPFAIPWSFARLHVAQGSWHLVSAQGACALIYQVTAFGEVFTNIAAMAGELADCHKVVALIEGFAREHGSSKVCWVGRRGWTKAFPDYHCVAYVGVKEL